MTTTNRTDAFLSRLEGVRPNGNGFTALCPGHGDTTPSLSITEVDGKILLYCHAGCLPEAIVASLGLTMSDLFLDGHKTKSEQRQIEAIYLYNGFEVVRTNPKGFYQRQPDGKGGYLRHLKGITPTLYHQDRLKQAIDSGTPVYVVEGEKDTDRLRGLGLVATCNPMGAGKWRDSYSEALRGADLVIIPDNDKPGREHAAQVAKSCYGIAKRVRILELPGGDKSDVSDWLGNGGDIAQLKELAEACPDYEPKSADTPASSDVKLRCMADVKAEAVSWLWKPYIPKGKVTLEEGDPGIGKSWVSLAIATAVSLGKGLPGQEVSEPANVVLASAEDGLGDTIRPRLDAMGADVSRIYAIDIYAIDGALTLDDSGFTLLEDCLESVSPALLIIDPLVAFIGADVDINRANETRSVMARLARLAEKHEIAILAVRHLTKGNMSKAIYRGLGSIDITAACRSVLMAGCDPENPQKRALIHIKSNLAPTGASIGYELREGGFYWTGVSNLTAAQILASENDAGTSAGDEAADFLRDELREGPVDASQVWRDARDMGLSESTIKRTKAMLGVITQRQSDTGGKKGGGKWTWGLPDPGAQPDQGYQGGVYKSLTPLIPSSFESTTMSNPDEPLDPPPEVMNLGYQGNLNCVKGTGGCKLRTDPDKPLDCPYSPKNCLFLLKRGGGA